MQVILFVLIIGILVFLIIKKVSLQFVFILGSFLFVVLFKRNVSLFIDVLLITLRNSKTWQLIGAVLLMLLFNDILRKTERLQLLIDSIKELVKSIKLVVVFIPALMGFLPMLGGAMISAPLVREVLNDYNVTNEKKTLINYWYRHIWEYILPLYPGIILASGLLNIDLSKLILHQAPITLLAMATGVLFLFDLKDKNPKKISKYSKHISKKPKNFDYKLKKKILSKKLKDHYKKLKKETIFNLLTGLLPILAVIVAVAVFKINIIIVLTIVITILLITFKKYIPGIYRDFDYKKYLSMFFIVFGLMLFKDSFIESGAVNVLPEYLISNNVPNIIIIALIPLVAGLMTGITHAAVGISFPIIMPFLFPETGINMGSVVLAFMAGFAGVLLSPIHVCLAITKDYFNADSKKLYKSLFPAVLIMLVGAFALYFLYQ